MDPEDVLTTGKIALLARVSQQTAIRWIDKGLLKGYTLPGSKRRVVQVGEFLDFLSKYGMPIPRDLRPTGLDNGTKVQ